MTLPTPSPSATTALTPTGALRAAINLRNFLLVTGTNDNGDPVGVSPDLAAVLAQQLDVPLHLIGYANPGDLADDAASDAWDVGNVGATQTRSETIRFTPAYSEIEATYLVTDASPLIAIDQVDQPGIRIAVSARTAYDNWLTVNLKQAELVRAEGNDATLELYRGGQLAALAGLRPWLLGVLDNTPGHRLIDGRFTAVQQAIGTPRHRADDGIGYLTEFVNAAVSSGLIAELIERHNVRGLSVAS